MSTHTDTDLASKRDYGSDVSMIKLKAERPDITYEQCVFYNQQLDSVRVLSVHPS